MSETRPKETFVSVSDFVVLPGLTVPLEAFRLVLDLEARGIYLDDDGEYLLVGPSELLTDQDRAQIRRWKPHLRAIVEYDADQHGRAQ